MIPRISHSRSQLRSHVNSYENGAYSFFVSSDVYPALFDHHHAGIVAMSPHGWKSSKGGTMKYLWFTDLDDSSLAEIEDWRARFEKYVLLGLNQHIAGFFTDELDFCMALDFNYDPAAERRTIYGEAEYQLKYRASRQHFQVLRGALVEAVPDLPISAEHEDNFCISCVPGPSDRGSVQYRLAAAVARALERDFVDADLNCPKPGLKGVSVAEKIPICRQLYEDGCVELSGPVDDRLVVVIDDLYQSGATLWMYAKFLKEQGARYVIGLPCVKSLRDSDNQ